MSLIINTDLLKVMARSITVEHPEILNSVQMPQIFQHPVVSKACITPEII